MATPDCRSVLGNDESAPRLARGAAADPDQLVAAVGPTVQRYLTGEIGSR